MIERVDKIGYEEWDSPRFIVPKNFYLDENSKLHEAIKVFYLAGGFDFFKVINPEKYATNWLDFVGNSLIMQGVPEIFTNDIENSWDSSD